MEQSTHRARGAHPPTSRARRAHLSALVFATLLAGVPVSAAAQRMDGPVAPGTFALGLKGGGEIVVEGELHGGTSAPVPDLGALNPALAGVGATLQVQPRSWDDVYGDLWSVAGEVGYGLDANAETFAAISYTKGSGDRLEVGGANVPALATTLPLFGDFGDFEAWGLELGYRRWFDADGPVRPYAAVRGMAQWVDSIEATFTIPAADIALNNVAFYDSGVVWGVGLDVGVAWVVSPAVSVGLETGLQYTGDLSDDDSDIGGLGLGVINDTGSRLSLPFRATVRARF